MLNLGIMLSNGRRQYPREVELIFTDSGGTDYRAVMDEPAIVAGRMDDFVVPLPAGASLKLPLRPSPADQTINPTKTYTARAEFVGKPVRRGQPNGDLQGMALMPYWTGKVVSNTISVNLPLAK